MTSASTSPGRCSVSETRTCLLFWAALVFPCMFSVLPASAEEAVVTDSTKKDCRYEGVGMTSSNGGSSSLEVFPENDVFRPLWADPKQPQLFAAWQSTRVRSNNTSVALGTVGFGENFGLIGKRNGCNGWQIGILAGVFAQFNLDEHSKDLINADYVVGIPFSWRTGLFSGRVRLFHQSSHLGDEFVLNNPGVSRVDYGFEVLEAILSLDAPRGWGRLYGGGATALHVTPSGIDRNSVHWGTELRAPTVVAPLLARYLPRLRLTPVFGADFQAFEELSWTINTNVAGGVEWSSAGSDRRFRLLINYYNGYSPYGQFFGTKLEMVGFGVYISF